MSHNTADNSLWSCPYIIIHNAIVAPAAVIVLSELPGQIVQQAVGGFVAAAAVEIPDRQAVETIFADADIGILKK